MAKEIRIFFTALMFYTRIPCPKWVDHDPAYMKDSARYFSLVGGIVGVLGAAVFYLASQLFSIEIAVILSMAVTVRITGAFHEDGFADVCDGFGGGWTKERIIEIMKDSRLGTFGVAGLFFIFLLKFYALTAIAISALPLVIVSGHVVSRMVASRMLLRGSYVENNNQQKAGSAATKLAPVSFFVNVLIAAAVLVLFNSYYAFLLLVPLFLVEWLMFRFYKKWINGYNGDCAGAVQQITEVCFYLSCIVLWKYTSLDILLRL